MDEQELFGKVKAALETLFLSDSYLLAIGARETSISHMLAVHLRDYFFPDYHIDCEYNRHGSLVKRLRMRNAGDELYFVPAKAVIPDVIIHERGTDERNLLVVEIKTQEGAEAEANDVAKLKGFTDEKESFNYTTGLFLRFDLEKCELSNVVCFRNGQEVTGTVWDGLKGLGYGE